MTTGHPFRKCHLQILRSLYVGHNGGTTKERQDDKESLGEDFQDKSNDFEGVAMDKGTASEGPVGSGTWDLVERFLQRRMEYHPLKDRRIHWSNTEGEAQSRLDRLASAISTTTSEENVQVSMARASSLTPRTPLFSVSGRGSTTPSMSLTPLSSNKKAPTSSQSERAWNVISQMLQKRSKLCTESCQSFRSQPFLGQLRDEAETRCAVLHGVLASLKVGTHGKHTREENSTSGTRKRCKLNENTSLRHFFATEYSELTRNAVEDENHVDNDAVMETQMKLYLWSSLLSSVKEIANESQNEVT